jgi:hydrogenase maturation protease
VTQPRILIAGIGNIFLGDDAFGVEVAQRMSMRPSRAGVRLVDFGIRGMALAYALLDSYDMVILVDAVPRGELPGTLFLIEPDLPEVEGADGAADMLEIHGMNPLRVLRLARSMGGQLPAIRLVGCEPAVLGTEEDPVMGLSDPVSAAVDEAIRLIDRLCDAALGAESAPLESA